MMINELLKKRLATLAMRRRRFELWCRLAGCWAGAGLLGIGVILIERRIGWASSLVLPLLVVGAGMAAIWIINQGRRSQPDWSELARQVEIDHPELQGCLLTAIQQQPADGRGFNYLQNRLLQQALRHSLNRDWGRALPGHYLVRSEERRVGKE